MQLELTDSQLNGMILGAVPPALAMAAAVVWYGVRRLRTVTVGAVAKGWATVFVGVCLFGFGTANWADHSPPIISAASPHSLSDNPEVAKVQMAVVASRNDYWQSRPVGASAVVPYPVAVPLTLLGIAIALCGAVTTGNGYAARH